MAVGEHLDLDVARVVQVALEVDGRVGEELLALAAGALEGALELVLGQRHAEALAAAAAGRLDGDREADLVAWRSAARRRRVATGSVVPGHDRHAGGLHQLARARLRAHRLDRARGRADEDDARRPRRPARTARSRPGSRSRGGSPGRPSALRDVEDLLDVQVVLGRRAVAEVVGLAGARDVRRVAVELGVDGDARDAQLLQRAHDADRDLAAVGDQDLLEHRARKLSRRRRPDARAGRRLAGARRRSSPRRRCRWWPRRSG